MESTREYEITGTDYYAVKSKERQTVYDCDGDVVTEVPVDWNEYELGIWAHAYESGVKKGESWGKCSGEHQTQTAVLKALGIYERLHDLESGMKLIASVLYHHDGICKDDVAGIAGRE